MTPWVKRPGGGSTCQPPTGFARGEIDNQEKEWRYARVSFEPHVCAGLKVGVGVERLAEPHEKMLRLAQTGVDTDILHPFSVFSLDSGRHPRLGQVTRYHHHHGCGGESAAQRALLWRASRLASVGTRGNSISGLPTTELQDVGPVIFKRHEEAADLVRGTQIQERGATRPRRLLDLACESIPFSTPPTSLDCDIVWPHYAISGESEMTVG